MSARDHGRGGCDIVRAVLMLCKISSNGFSFPPVDNIGAVSTIWSIRGKNVRTVRCCIMD